METGWFAVFSSLQTMLWDVMGHRVNVSVPSLLRFRVLGREREFKKKTLFTLSKTGGLGSTNCGPGER